MREDTSRTRKKNSGNSSSFFEDQKIPAMGIEPILPREHDFESRASTNSATPASLKGRSLEEAPPPVKHPRATFPLKSHHRDFALATLLGNLVLSEKKSPSSFHRNRPHAGFPAGLDRFWTNHRDIKAHVLI